MATLDLALIGNGTIGALVDPAGEITWACFPRFDGDPMFCSLLKPRADIGFFSIELLDRVETEQQYLHNTPVVITRMTDAAGGIIEINLIALTNGAAREKQVVAADIPGMATYGPCIKVGEFLLPSGLMAIGRDGHIVGSSVSPGFAGLAHAGHSQAAAIYDYAEALCQAGGTR